MVSVGACGGVPGPAAAVALILVCGPVAEAQGPTVVDSNLAVRTVVSGLSQPTRLAFLGPGDMLVLEKASGQVERVVNGVVTGVVLDLAVNSSSERGLLGIALHPESRDGDLDGGDVHQGAPDGASHGRLAASCRRCRGRCTVDCPTRT
jgi:hypothetical protein